MTPEELRILARAVAMNAIMPDELDDVVAKMTVQERKDILSLIWFEAIRIKEEDRRRRVGPPQQRAIGLLKTLLNAEQRQKLKTSKCFMVTGSQGGVYRLWPRRPLAEKIEKHGKRWYLRASYCYHDPGNLLPPADVTIAHLLLLTADEGEFLAKANYTPHVDLWDGAYLRRINATRRNSRRVTAGGEVLRAAPMSQTEIDALIASAIETNPEARAAFGTHEPIPSPAPLPEPEPFFQMPAVLAPPFPGRMDLIDLEVLRAHVPAGVLRRVRF